MTVIPDDFPVQPLTTRADKMHAREPAFCPVCRRWWDDGISTSMTPTPSARCPFEVFHS